MARPPILTLADVSLTFGGNPLFSDLSLTVEHGDRVALVGRNGSGKSTLMKIMAKLTEPDTGTRFLQPGAAVAYMEQDPDITAFATLGDFARHDLPPENWHLAEAALDGLKTDPATETKGASGGERRRAALARLIATDADLILLDEPTNHLDITAILWLEDYLKSLRKAIVLISHDRAFLRAITTATLWVDRGETRRRNTGFAGFEEWRDKVFEEEDLQRHKLNRLIKAEARWAVEGISARRKRNMGRVRRLGELRDERAGQIRRQGAAKMELAVAASSGKKVIEARDIARAVAGRTLFSDLSLKINRGDRVAFVGPNGVGKTTLLNTLIGKAEPDTGTVVLGSNLEMSFFDQNRDQLDLKSSLWESLAGAPEIGVSGRSDQVMVRGTPRHVVGYLKDFLFDEGQARGPVSALSGGEKARLILARIMARESNLLVLDEPTNDLDVETLDLLQEIIDEYAGTVLIVSHDRDFLDRVAATTIAMEGAGQVTVYAGGWSDYQSQKPQTDDVLKATGKSKRRPNETPKARPKPDLTTAQKDRLAKLPKQIDVLEAEIARLTEFLADPGLFSKSPIKFRKASAGLSERQALLEKAEEEWLILEELAQKSP